jgi:hypothetical protein
MVDLDPDIAGRNEIAGDGTPVDAAPDLPDPDPAPGVEAVGDPEQGCQPERISAEVPG